MREYDAYLVIQHFIAFSPSQATVHGAKASKKETHEQDLG
jgi:hypothetical protein